MQDLLVRTSTPSFYQKEMVIDNCIKSAYNNTADDLSTCCFIVFRKSQGTLAPLTFSFVFLKIIMEGGARTLPEGGSGTGPVRSLHLI